MSIKYYYILLLLLSLLLLLLLLLLLSHVSGRYPDAHYSSVNIVKAARQA